jgi:protein deglycase
LWLVSGFVFIALCVSLSLSHTHPCVPDSVITEAAGTYDAIVCPGGLPGAHHLAASAPLIALLKAQKAAGEGIYAAICASPAVVFAAHGLLGEGDAAMRATCYPAAKFRGALPHSDVTAADPRVVVDGKCVTSQGPGTSLEFGVALVECLLGSEASKKVEDALLIRRE